MKFFSFEDIKAAADCEQIAVALGLKVTDHRCAAVWRNGENPTSVHLDRMAYSDHGDGGKGGSVIDLVAAVRFNGDINQAQEWLGNHLGLTPTMETVPNPTGGGTHYDRLISDGFAEVCRYDYTDAAGAVIFQVVRLQHPEKGKEFLQCAADGKWSVKGIEKVLYNLPQVAKADAVIVVEGEKDVQTLAGWNMVATCNPGGAGKWQDSFSATLAGKDVVLLLDNDPAGQNHGAIVAGSLAGKAKSIRVLTVSKLPKGDVTDWAEQEGGAAEALLALIAEAKPVDPATLSESYAVALAKDANKTPFRNYTQEWQKTGGNKPAKEPRHVNDLIKDARARFLGFPRKVGETLFDHDRETNRICFLEKPPQLFAWIARKSGQLIDWTGGAGMTPKEEFFEAVRAAARRYESVSSTPDWPQRDDVYYSYGRLPEPSPNLEDFNHFVSFFLPATPADLCLIRALVCSPLFFLFGRGRPVFIIDSERPGSGKSTLATIIAELHGHDAIEVKTRDFARDMQEVTKRLVSATGRQARVLLVDNITGTFHSEEFSSLITMPSITGRPSYGHGEESRPNNLTYIITANNATVDNDLSIRSFFVTLRCPDNYSSTWNTELRQFMHERRLNIFADIFQLLSSHTPFPEAERPATRFPEFETKILQPCCGTFDAYCDTIKHIAQAREDANIDEEYGATINEAFRHNLVELGIHPDHESTFIRSPVADLWVRKALPEMRFQNTTHLLRNLSRSGHLSRIHPGIKIYPHRGADRRRGLLWLNEKDETTPLHVLRMQGEKVEMIPAGHNSEPNAGKLPGSDF